MNYEKSFNPLKKRQSKSSSSSFSSQSVEGRLISIYLFIYFSSLCALFILHLVHYIFRRKSTLFVIKYNIVIGSDSDCDCDCDCKIRDNDCKTNMRTAHSTLMESMLSIASLPSPRITCFPLRIIMSTLSNVCSIMSTLYPKRNWPKSFNITKGSSCPLRQSGYLGGQKTSPAGGSHSTCSPLQCPNQTHCPRVDQTVQTVRSVSIGCVRRCASCSCPTVQ